VNVDDTVTSKALLDREGDKERKVAREGAPVRRWPFSAIPTGIAIGVACVLLVGALMMWRATAKVNRVALASAPKPVSAGPVVASTYQPSRTYVGTLRPWVEANVGPQYISAYVDTVLVRPGAVVKQGDVLATLDCRDPSAAAQSISHIARSIEARQKALADQAARTHQLLAGGFVSPNEAELQLARSTAEEAQLQAQKSSLAKSSLSVKDCVLRAPFDGEVSVRSMDPGAFVRPGMPIATVVDRNTIRMTADAPESDFDDVAEGTPVTVHVVATGKDIAATVSRRAPAADLGTRTVHFEVDIRDPQRQIPVNTTGEVTVRTGQPVAAIEVPLSAASVTGKKATVFTIEAGTARSVTAPILGEIGSNVFFANAAFKPGTEVVFEGRALLKDGDRVAVHQANPPTGSAATVVADPSSSSGG